MIAPARAAAFEILLALSKGNADLPTAIAAARTTLADDRDRALAANIATGVQRWRATLDHLIAQFSQRSIDRLDREIVEILRLSLFQLLHFTRVPAAAVVDDAVDLARKAGKSSASGFVNAVLRKASRSRTALPLPGCPSDAADREQALEYLSVSLSHPRWLAARWYDRLGFETAERWMTFNNAPAPLTLRANRLRLSPTDLAERLESHEIKVEKCRYAPDGLVITHGQPLRDPGAETGWFVVQDEASQLVSLLAAPPDGSRVLDACASPGGKTTSLAAAVGSQGRIVACDVRSRRMALLRKTVERCGGENVRLLQADLLSPLPFDAVFDVVMVDAPCSGLGTLRRDPDIRWRRQESDLPLLAANQARMLRHAADAVKPGGRLVYATCSSEPEENEEIASAFLAADSRFRPVHAGVIPEVPTAVVDAAGHLRTTPDHHDLGAFFGAVFERVVRS